MGSEPMTSIRVGAYQHWRIVNRTAELHPFHIHQVHFLANTENGVPLAHPAWLDTVNVPVGGSVDVILDSTNPVIKGMAVFHCHRLNHEDKGQDPVQVDAQPVASMADRCFVAIRLT